MYVYFNKEGKLTTIIPHGEIVRQGTWFTLKVLLDEDVDISTSNMWVRFKRNKSAVGDINFQGSFAMVKKGVETFEKVDKKEQTFDLVEGKKYKVFEYKVTSDTGLTQIDGDVELVFQLIIASKELENATTEDIKMQGLVHIWVEPTYGSHPERGIDISVSQYDAIIQTINQFQNNYKVHDIQISEDATETKTDYTLTIKYNDREDLEFTTSYIPSFLYDATLSEDATITIIKSDGTEISVKGVTENNIYEIIKKYIDENSITAYTQYEVVENDNVKGYDDETILTSKATQEKLSSFLVEITRGLETGDTLTDAKINIIKNNDNVRIKLRKRGSIGGSTIFNSTSLSEFKRTFTRRIGNLEETIEIDFEKKTWEYTTVSYDTEQIEADLTKKLDKVTPIGTGIQAYVVSNDGTKIEQTTMIVSQNAESGTLVQRGVNGEIKVATPLTASDSANKEYVDNKKVFVYNSDGVSVQNLEEKLFTEVWNLHLFDNQIFANTNVGSNKSKTFFTCEFEKVDNANNRYLIAWYIKNGHLVKYITKAYSMDKTFATNELIEIETEEWFKLLTDDDVATFVPKITETGNRVYVTNTEIGQVYTDSNVPNTMMYRGTDGRAKLESPTLPKHIANKEYVDGETKKKVSVNETYFNKSMVYVSNPDTSTQKMTDGMVVANDVPTANSIVRRTSTGTMKSQTPSGTDNQEVVNIGYANNNYAKLVDGKIPSSQLPSYVDDILEFSSFDNFPTNGESGKLYVDTSTNSIYRWSGTAYINMSSMSGGLILGEIEGTAWEGSKGKESQTAINEMLDGNLVVAKATADADGNDIQETYATKVEINNKVDKVTTTAYHHRVYGIDINGSQRTFNASSGIQNNAIVERTSNGNIKTTEPIAEDDVAPKSYVDNLNVMTLTLEFNSSTYLQDIFKTLWNMQAFDKVVFVRFENQTETYQCRFRLITNGYQLIIERIALNQITTWISNSYTLDTDFTTTNPTFNIYNFFAFSNDTMDTKLDKITTTAEETRFYAIGTDGTQKVGGVCLYPSQDKDLCVPQYSTTGQIKTNTPSSLLDCANKEYVDDTISSNLNNKLTKVEVSDNVTYVYTHKNTEQGSINVSQDVVGSSIVQRRTDGTIKAKTPTESDTADTVATKGYVTDKLSGLTINTVEVSLTGESGTLTDTQMGQLESDKNNVILHSGVVYRCTQYPFGTDTNYVYSNVVHTNGDIVLKYIIIDSSTKQWSLSETSMQKKVTVEETSTGNLDITID